MRYLLCSIFLTVMLPVWVGTAAADQSAIRIGYVPATVPGPLNLFVAVDLGSCTGRSTSCGAQAPPLRTTFPEDDAVAVMAAIDQWMGLAVYCPVFEAPVSIPGATPGEVRHEYRIMPTAPDSGIVSSLIQFDRGAISLGLVSPCGPDEPDVIGPYTIYFVGRPAAAGTFKLLCRGKPEVDVAIDPSYTARAIADSVYAAAKNAGIDVGQLAEGYDEMDDVIINSHRFQQDVTALDYVGMSDGAAMEIWVMTNLDWWVTPAQRVTWGSVKAQYR